MNALLGIRANAMGGSNLIARIREVSASQNVKRTTATAAEKSAVVEKSADETTSATSSTTETTQDSGTATRVVKKELDRDAFLQLLCLQMQSQDPLEPTDNTQMIAQLAQFSSLEQMNNLNTSFKSLKEDINRLNFISAGDLIGKTITGVDAEGTVREGKVERVSLDDKGVVNLVVDGKSIPFTQLQKIA